MNTKTLLLFGLLQACDVPIIRPTEVGLGDGSTKLNNDAGCPQGLVVAATDLSQSTNIGLMSTSGQVLSPSIISTASHAPGLTVALGGDIAFPSSPASGGEIVILDRYPRSVLTWVNLDTATVRTQLSVATGFSANPHDYVSIRSDKAYVPRFDPNANPGREAYDAGSDVLIIDPSVPSIVGRIDISAALPKQSSYFVHPDRARLVGDRVYLVVPYYDSTYDSGNSYVVAIDTQSDAIVDSLWLNDLSGCSGIDSAPDQASVAVVCSGRWQGTSSADVTASAIVGIQLKPRLTEIWRVSATSVGPRALGFDVAYVDTHRVLALQLGDLGPPLVNDVAYAIDFTTGKSTEILRSADVPVTLGLGPCSYDCGQCFMADAQRKQVHRLQFVEPQGWSMADYDWDDPTGLPPRIVAFF